MILVCGKVQESGLIDLWYASKLSRASILHLSTLNAPQGAHGGQLQWLMAWWWARISLSFTWWRKTQHLLQVLSKGVGDKPQIYFTLVSELGFLKRKNEEAGINHCLVTFINCCFRRQGISMILQPDGPIVEGGGRLLAQLALEKQHEFVC